MANPSTQIPPAHAVLVLRSQRELPSLLKPTAARQVLPMTQKGLRANFNLPLQPRYRQQHPAAQILTKYSTPNTTMVTISCKGDHAISPRTKPGGEKTADSIQTALVIKVHCVAFYFFKSTHWFLCSSSVLQTIRKPGSVSAAPRLVFSIFLNALGCQLALCTMLHFTRVLPSRKVKGLKLS